MQKVILKYGLIAGGIVSVVMLLGTTLWADVAFSNEYGELIGYTTMIIALSLIFFGVKSYRDNYQSGVINFGKGFQIGILITAIASVMYAGTWEVALQTQPKLSNFMDNYTAKHLEKMKERGASAEEIETESQKMDKMIAMYKNPLLRFGMTLVEILPVGILITLLSAAILRKKE